MFGLIGHLTSLEHAQSVARELGYPEYADQGLEFWCSAPPQIVDRIKVTSATGQQIEGLYVESCFLPEMLAGSKIKTAIRKILNAMALAQKNDVDITALGGFSSIIFMSSVSMSFCLSALTSLLSAGKELLLFWIIWGVSIKFLYVSIYSGAFSGLLTLKTYR